MSLSPTPPTTRSEDGTREQHLTHPPTSFWTTGLGILPHEDKLEKIVHPKHGGLETRSLDIERATLPTADVQCGHQQTVGDHFTIHKEVCEECISTFLVSMGQVAAAFPTSDVRALEQMAKMHGKRRKYHFNIPQPNGLSSIWLSYAIVATTCIQNQRVSCHDLTSHPKALHGQNNTAAPSRWSVTERAKWDAWNSLAKMSQLEAMVFYVQLVEKVWCKTFLPEGVGCRRVGLWMLLQNRTHGHNNLSL